MQKSRFLKNGSWPILGLIFVCGSVNARYFDGDVKLDTSAAEPRAVYDKTIRQNPEAQSLIYAPRSSRKSDPIVSPSRRNSKILRPAISFSYNDKKDLDAASVESKQILDQTPEALDYYKYLEKEKAKTVTKQPQSQRGRNLVAAASGDRSGAEIQQYVIVGGSHEHSAEEPVAQQQVQHETNAQNDQEHQDNVEGESEHVKHEKDEPQAEANHHHHQHHHHHNGHTGNEHKGGEFEKGGGKEFDAFHHGEHGEKGGKDYEGHHTHEKGEKGYDDKDDHSKEYAEKGGHKKVHHHDDGYHAEHHKEHGGKKGADYKEEGEHSKGHSSKGSHSIHKKEEFEKKTEFFDEDHDGDEFEKHGGYSHEGKFDKGGHSKGGHDKGGKHEEHHGKDSKSEEGGFYKDDKGHHDKEGHDHHHDHDTKHGEKHEDSGGIKHGYKKSSGDHGHDHHHHHHKGHHGHESRKNEVLADAKQQESKQLDNVGSHSAVKNNNQPNYEVQEIPTDSTENLERSFASVDYNLPDYIMKIHNAVHIDPIKENEPKEETKEQQIVVKQKEEKKPTEQKKIKEQRKEEKKPKYQRREEKKLKEQRKEQKKQKEPVTETSNKKYYDSNEEFDDYDNSKQITKRKRLKRRKLQKDLNGSFEPHRSDERPAESSRNFVIIAADSQS